MPVMGSNFVFNCAIDHAGVMRRSDAEYSEMTWRGTSAMVSRVVVLWDNREPGVEIRRPGSPDLVIKGWILELLASVSMSKIPLLRYSVF